MASESKESDFPQPINFESKKLCQISVVDCRHDFKLKEKVEEYKRKADVTLCDNNSQESLSWYLQGEGFYNQYKCYSFGNIDFETIHKSQIYLDSEEINSKYEEDIKLEEIFGGGRKFHLVVDFDTAHFKEKLLRFGNNIQWVVNAQTEFDFAPLGKPSEYTEYDERNSVLYLNSEVDLGHKNSRNKPIILNSSGEGYTDLFFMKPFSKIIMFFEKNMAYSLILKNKKAVLIDKSYANKNGNVQDIITSSRTIKDVMKKFREILEGNFDKTIANNLTKFVAKRLGDQGQVISSLINISGVTRVFVTHDSVARDFAILIGVPIVVFTKTNIDRDYSYVVYQRKDLLSSEVLHQLEDIRLLAIREREERQIRIYQNLNEIFLEQKYLVKKNLKNFELQFSKLSNKDEQMDLFKKLLINIIDSVYFLKTYSTNTIRIRASKVLQEPPELIQFIYEKKRFESMKRKWNDTDKLKSTNDIRSIISSYICFEEIKKIDEIFQENETEFGKLSDLFRLSLYRFYSIIESENDMRLSPSKIFMVNAQILLQSIKSDLFVSEKINEIKRKYFEYPQRGGKAHDKLIVKQKGGMYKEELAFHIIDEHFHLLIYMIVEIVSRLQAIIYEKSKESFGIGKLLDIDIINTVFIIIDMISNDASSTRPKLEIRPPGGNNNILKSSVEADVFDNESFVYPFEYVPEYCEQPSEKSPPKETFLNILQNSFNNDYEDLSSIIHNLGRFIRDYFYSLPNKIHDKVGITLKFNDCMNLWLEVYEKFKYGYLKEIYVPNMIPQGAVPSMTPQGANISVSLFAPTPIIINTAGTKRLRTRNNLSSNTRKIPRFVPGYGGQQKKQRRNKTQKYQKVKINKNKQN